MAVPTEGEFDAAHHALVADRSLQFQLSSAPQPTPPPPWLETLVTRIGHVIEAISPALAVIFQIGLVVAALIIVWIVVRETLTRARAARARAAAGLSPETRAFQPTLCPRTFGHRSMFNMEVIQ